jgi:hypothetical protein
MEHFHWKQEIFDYSHVPGGAVLHLGRHRHGVRATTSGHRINLLLWCRRYFLSLPVNLTWPDFRKRIIWSFIKHERLKE